MISYEKCVQYINSKLTTTMHVKTSLQIMRWIARIKLKYLLALFVALVILHVAGVLTRLFETDYKKYFSYPYEGDIEKLVLQLKNNVTPDVKPINFYNYSYITNCKHKCHEQLRLVFLIKSAPEHFDRRLVIRQTWGYESRFSDVQIRTVFLLGRRSDSNLMKKILDEHERFDDIVQANFQDVYFNNTIKTMMGFKWAATFCPHSKFYMFVDDDMYVSTKNVLRYLRHPTKYPEYLYNQRLLINNVLLRSRRHIDIELPDGIRLYTGSVKLASPLRDWFSKWYITLEEYPYDYFPLYATAGAYMVSTEALKDMYYTSFYTKHFRFDDVYLGLVALKAAIEPFNTDYVYLNKKTYKPEEYNYVIASHGYDDPAELMKVWTEQKELGNA